MYRTAVLYILYVLCFRASVPPCLRALTKLLIVEDNSLYDIEWDAFLLCRHDNIGQLKLKYRICVVLVGVRNIRKNIRLV